ncbi:hypothetical protein [Chitinophaga vietnamensis]|uniref:hypothetical protein n=1 Tax=Chitinophaga vietnamensis TaxID=2593957 RepID=UPI0011789BFE|nr:hypothetical protein [Chitinophaga vietnamensis]
MENFYLTPEEAAIVRDAQWIQLKNSVMHKVMVWMGEMQQALAAADEQHRHQLAPEWLAAGPKISRGEQYKGLPWVILDYPRFFSRSEVFAFRTMFWWGHYFSCTLHLAGTVKERYLTALLNGYTQLAERDFQVYMQEDPWQHDFGNSNYRPIGSFSFEEWKLLLDRHGFIKLAKPFALEDWKDVINGVAAAYAALLDLLNS